MVVGSGKHTFEVIENWAKVPPGWNAPMVAVTVDSQDRVYGFNRGEHPVIVFDKNGEFLYSWGEGLFAFPHGIRADSQDNIWIVDRNGGQIFKFTTRGEVLMTIGTRGYRSDTGADGTTNRKPPPFVGLAGNRSRAVHAAAQRLGRQQGTRARGRS